ncbi:MAG: hypothetical protein ABJG88_09055 [Litorimonas sp.]
MMRYLSSFVLVSAAFVAGCNISPASAQSDAETKSEAQALANTEKMTAEALTALIKKFDEDALVQGNAVQFTLQERDLLLVYDESADRMRVITPIGNAALANEELMARMLQANYDAVLDARYAVANDLIWAVYIHKLSTAAQDDFLSGVAQVVTAAETFGTSFTSGAMVFGGGDTSGIHEDLLKQLEEAAEEDAKGTGI